MKKMGTKALGLSVLAVCFMSSMAIICDKNSCKGVDCTEIVPADHRTPCKANQTYNKFGTECGCCEACVTILGEGSYCESYTGIGDPPPLEECKDGLICRPVGDSLFPQKCMKPEIL